MEDLHFYGNFPHFNFDVSSTVVRNHSKICK